MREYKDIKLKDRNTFGIDAVCAEMIEYAGVEDLKELFARGVFGSRWMVLSGGSNILFTEDFDGVLLHPVDSDIRITGECGDMVSVRATAGTDWDRFVGWSVANGLWGAENLSAIPGLVGASPVQNIGAYGVEVKDIIRSVELFAVDTGKEVTVAGAHCDFGYRDSIFKRSLKGKVIITAVNFELSRRENPVLGYGDLYEKTRMLGGATLENIRRAVVGIRDAKLPDPKVMGNAGSFFKNPVVPEETALELKAKYADMPIYPSQQSGCVKLAAGWLIDKSGWKGRSLGRVGIHERQALVIVNLGGATGKEVVEFATRIQADVQYKFGVRIDTEVNIV